MGIVFDENYAANCNLFEIWLIANIMQRVKKEKKKGLVSPKILLLNSQFVGSFFYQNNLLKKHTQMHSRTHEIYAITI